MDGNIWRLQTFIEYVDVSTPTMDDTFEPITVGDRVPRGLVAQGRCASLELEEDPG